ncbi:Uncharacterised protein [Vibrio cholerae]|nr:Uncharacterised protein [Vibrio cholerae]
MLTTASNFFCLLGSSLKLAWQPIMSTCHFSNFLSLPSI